MTTVYVARHGQTQWNYERRAQGQLNSDLTELGERQAKALGERLADTDFDYIYTSHLGRTKQTAAIALAGRDLPTAHRADLNELHFGDWEGLTWDQINAIDAESLKYLFEQPSKYTTTSGESIYQFVDRIKDAFEDIVNKHPEQTVLIVVHGGVIKALMYVYDHGVIDEFWSCEPYAEPTSLSILTEKDGAISVVQKPDASHLLGIE